MALVCSRIHFICVIYFFAVVVKVQHIYLTQWMNIDIVFVSVMASMTSTQLDQLMNLMCKHYSSP